MTSLGTALSASLILLSILVGPGSAKAGVIAAMRVAPEQLGVYSDETPSNLGLASTAGVGLIRANANLHNDAKFELAAAARLRMYPVLGVPRGGSPAGDEAKMEPLVAAFAKRYGPRGSFWQQRRALPYLPVQSFEIGDEPNVPLQFEPDSSTLQYGSPAGYAKVYEAVRTALHQSDRQSRGRGTARLRRGAFRHHRAISRRPRSDRRGRLPPLPLQRTRDGARHARPAPLAERAWARADPDRLNEFASRAAPQPEHLLLGRPGRRLHALGPLHPGLGAETVIPFWWGATGDAVERRLNPVREPGLVPLVGGMRLAGLAGFARF